MDTLVWSVGTVIPAKWMWKVLTYLKRMIKYKNTGWEASNIFIKIYRIIFKFWLRARELFFIHVRPIKKFKKFFILIFKFLHTPLYSRTICSTGDRTWWWISYKQGKCLTTELSPGPLRSSFQQYCKIRIDDFLSLACKTIFNYDKKNQQMWWQYLVKYLSIFL